MKTLVVAASKGGAGKTTLAVHLAVLAARSRSTVLVDLDDPQRSAASWWKRRETGAPGLVEAESHQLRAVQREAAARGVELLVVDTAPRCDLHPLLPLVSFIVVPSRPGILDLEAVGRSVAEISRTGTAGCVVLNAVPPGRGSREASIVQEARQVLSTASVPVAPVSIGLRASLAHALITGLAVHEYEPGGKGAGEIERLWTWIDKEMA